MVNYETVSLCFLKVDSTESAFEGSIGAIVEK